MSKGEGREGILEFLILILGLLNWLVPVGLDSYLPKLTM